MDEYKKISRAKEPLFTFGHIGPGMLNRFILMWAMMYYMKSDLLTGILIGWALTSGNVLKAVAGPIVANWSDHFKSKRFGRRIPFMMIGLIPMVASFIMMWNVPHLGSMTATFIWVLVWINLFYFTYDIVVTPYLALLPEIAKEPGDRARIQGYISLFGIIGMGFTMGASGHFIQKMGYGQTALIFSIVCIAAVCVPFFVVRTNKDHVPAETADKHKSVFYNLKEALTNKTFAMYLVAIALFYMGFNMVFGGIPFVASELLGLKESATSTMVISSIAVALLLIPVFQHVIKKKGCLFAFRTAAISFVVIAALIPVVTQFTFIPPMVRGLILMALMGFPDSALMVIPNVLLSEIIDEDSLATGSRREGIFFGTQGLITNTIVAIAALFNGYLFDLVGGPGAGVLEVKLLGPIAAVFALCGYFAFRRIKIKAEK